MLYEYSADVNVTLGAVVILDTSPKHISYANSRGMPIALSITIVLCVIFWNHPTKKIDGKD